MFKFEPVGKYLVNICQTMSCALMGADRADAPRRGAPRHQGRRDDRPTALITLEHAECQAACTEAPCLQVNYRYRYRVTPEQLDQLFDDLRAGALDGEIPPHGTLARERQHIPSDRGVGARPPEDVTGPPPWIRPPEPS